MNVFILTEGGKNIGFGHITRCLSIYQAFEEKGITPTLLIQGDDTIRPLVKKKRYRLVNWLDSRDRLAFLLDDADMVIIDSYLADTVIYSDISRIVKISVYIDDNKRISYPRGIVVNGTTYATKLGFQKTTDTIYLLGKQYALFRKEFWHMPKKHIKKHVSSILVFLGANDSRNLSPKILHLLTTEYPDWKKNIIMTDGFTNSRELYTGKDSKTILIKNPDAKKIKELMISSDIAITSGGQMIYELCRAGIPAIVIAIAENQQRSITDLKNLGVISYAGQWDDPNLLKTVKQYVEALDAYNLRASTSSKMRKVFDGTSTLHLVDKLIRYYKRYGYDKKT
jgi:spore coat polysaccharide biosynthesis predicted glycosyltransferase SpsG